jgi:BirA family biotin operon repressor/biotin-[acetyl-CoA-carboxylase] ligase
MRWRDVWKRSGFAPVRKAWMKRAWGLGEKIAFNAAPGRIEGVFCGLGEDGALLLKTDEGIQSFHAGDVEHVKLAQGSA